LQTGIDISVIALCLGHESPVATHHVEDDLSMKERALAKLYEPTTTIRRYRAPDSLIGFLRALSLCEGRNSCPSLPIGV
jgi:hypothetical protein